MIEEHNSSKVSRRLQEKVASEICDLIYSPRLASFGEEFPHLTAINQAHVHMLYQQKLIPEAAAKSLAAALLQMEEEGADAVTLDPQREDCYFNYEAHLIDKVGLDIGGRMHTARSRNDIYATMDRLRARQIILEIAALLLQLREVALEKAEEYSQVIMPGYTHLQPAQPITYGFYLAGVAQALSRDSARLMQAYQRLNQSSLGAGAFTGTPYAIDRAHTARLLGFSDIVQNTLDAVASRDFILELFSCLSILATTWSRIAQDYFIWATDEFRLIDFPDRIAGTSSIMPQKKNLIVLEYLKGRAGHIAGQYFAAISIVRATNFTHSNEANSESTGGFWSCAKDSVRSLKLLALIITSAMPRQDVMFKRAAGNFSTATDIADMLVEKADISFRQAHHIVGAVVYDAMAEGQVANEISLKMIEKAYLHQTGRKAEFTLEDVEQCLDPRLSVAKRKNGGPEAQTNLALIGQLKQDLQQDRHLVEQNRQMIEEANMLRKRLLTELSQ